LKLIALFLSPVQPLKIIKRLHSTANKGGQQWATSLRVFVFGAYLLAAATNLPAQSDLMRDSVKLPSARNLKNKARQPVLRRITGYIYATFETKEPVPGAIIKVSESLTTRADETGFYQIDLKMGDTVRFYHPTGLIAATYPAAYLLFYQHFNVYLKDPEYLRGQKDPGHELSQVKVTGRNYKKDSLMRRYLYSDIFNYKKPTLADAVAIPKVGKVPVPIAVGVSISGVIRWLHHKRNNKDMRFKQLAMYAEDKGYMDHRLSPGKIELYTGMKNEDSIRYLIAYFGPSATQLRNMNDLELGQYLIEKAHDLRIGALPPNAPSFSDYCHRSQDQNTQPFKGAQKAADTAGPGDRK